MRYTFTKRQVVFFILLVVLVVTSTIVNAQIITTVAGDGFRAGQPNSGGRYAGDGGLATVASFAGPYGLAVDDSGNIYVGDVFNNRIRKVSGATGIITTIAGTGTIGFSGDGGDATSARLYYPNGVALDDSANVYFADLYNNRIRKITVSTGIISTIAGSGSTTYSGDGGPATSAGINNPYGLFIDHSFNVYFSDTYNHCIRRIDKITGIITTVAGNGTQGYTGDGGAATSAQLYQPYDVALDDSGNMFIADSYNGVVRKVNAATGIISTIAGNNTFGYSGDGGPATAAQFSHILGIALDASGNVYASDESNNVVRRIDKSTGIITTVAGNGYGHGTSGNTGGSAGDGGPATSAELWIPECIFIDKCGNLYIGDYYNERVRKVTFAQSNLMLTPTAVTICNGGSTMLMASGSNSYAWVPATALSSISDSTVTANPTTSVTYTVTGTTGCASATATVAVTVNAASPLLTILPVLPKICSGQTIILSVSGGGSTFKWSPATGLNVVTGDSVVATGPSLVDSVVYTVIDTSVSACPGMGTVTLQINGSDTGGIVSAVRDTICQGTPGNLTLSNNSDTAVQWQSSTDDINFTDITGANKTKYKTTPLQETMWYRATAGTGNCAAVSDTLELYVPPALTASFNGVQTGANQLTFNSDSSLGNIRSYHWDFGDNQTSTGQNPEHTFPKDTTYYVCLTLYDGSNCSYTFCRYMDVAAEGIITVSAGGNWIIYPSPFSNKLTISAKQSNNYIQGIKIYDVLGRMFPYKYPASDEIAASFMLDVSALTAGIYFLEIKTSHTDYVTKVIKQ